jgi:peptide/nickel transport system ATP-binding protein
LLEVRGLHIHARLAGRRRTIASSIDLRLEGGETIGIVGESGSGKSMTARALIGLLPEGVSAEGNVVYRGRNLIGLREPELNRVRGSQISLLLQDPFTMLNPLLRIGTHIEESLPPATRSQLSRRELRQEAARRLAEVGLPDPSAADRYPFQLSGGMRQRVGLAAALAKDPEVLIADEPSTALDVTTQKEILALLKAIQLKRGMGLILITHDLRVAFSTCDRIYVLYAGSVVEVASASALEAEPLHPYSLGLLLSEPAMDHRIPQLFLMNGSVPTPDEVATICSFAPRCSWALHPCRAGKPALIPIASDHRSACVRLDNIRAEISTIYGTVRQQKEGPARQPVGVEPLAEVQAIHKTFNVNQGFGRSTGVAVLRDVSLRIGPNESVGLVGESGSGKTTLARCLVGLETPSRGSIVIDGVPAHDYSRLSALERKHIRQTIQIVFQDPYSSLNPSRTIGATLKEALSVGPADSGKLDVAMFDLLKRVGLSAVHASRKPAALSGGERQRVAIARALAVRPRLIVCDEPVSSLDVSVQSQILALFRSLQAELGMSYLFITHDLAVVRQVVDRVYVMFRGEIVENGSVPEVLDRPQHPYTRSLLASVPRAEKEWLANGPKIAARPGSASNR